MIYTLTLNPSVDYYMSITDLVSGQVNRSSAEKIEFGGKGINVSLMLKALGCKSRVITVLGGFTGRALLDKLQQLGIDCGYVEAEGNTRINVKLSDFTEINGSGVYVEKIATERLLKLLSSASSGDVVIMSGSACRGFDDDIYAFLIHKLKKMGVCCIVDTSGKLLKKAIEARPWLIKPNIYELGEIFNTKAITSEEVGEYSHRLIDQGVQNVLVTMGSEGAFFTDGNLDCFYKAPKIEALNTVGAGDCTLAGFVYQYLKTKNIEKSVNFAVKCGTKRAETGQFLTF